MCEIHRNEDLDGTKKGIDQFIDELIVATTNSRIYSRDHRRVTVLVDNLVRDLGDYLALAGGNHLVVGIAEGFLFHDRRPLLGASLSASKIIDALNEIGAGGISIDGKATRADFMALLRILGAPIRKHANYEEANRDLNLHGGHWIRFLPPYQAGDDDGASAEALLGTLGRLGGELEGERLDLNIPVELYQKTVSLLQDSMVRVCHGKDLAVDETRGYVESILDRLTIDATSMMSISRYERYDAYTFGHSIRVCFLALNFAKSLFGDQEMLLRVGTAALLHDIGKAWVPFEVLYSTSRLSPEERVEMNKHASHGAQILLQLVEPDPLWVASAFGHHRTLDGGGYPATMHEHRQSIGTRIVKICDVYEALTAVRPYKPRMSPVRAYRIMMSMKNHFDAGLLRRFVHQNGVFPVGSRLLLDTGQTARVLKQTRELSQPVIVLQSDSRKLSMEERTVDLSLHRGEQVLQIAEVLEAA